MKSPYGSLYIIGIMKKKISLIIAAAALSTLMVVGGTLAWFTDSEKVDNTITMGKVDIKLTEDEDEFPNVVPGAKINKNPVVENVGKNDAYVRAQVQVNVEGARDNVDIAADVIVELLDNTGLDWMFANGYFYYAGILTPGSKTGAIFNEFQLPTKWNNDVVGATIKIDIKVDAIQSDNILESKTGDIYKDIIAAFSQYTEYVAPTPTGEGE